jgi:RNA polymerase sigma-70 factor, ECF subfamily
MTESSRDLLRRHFLIGYDDLKFRLTKRLGSAELASDALHDAWLRLQASMPIEPIRRPLPYILRVAYNIALKRLLGERAIVSLDAAREALDLRDDTHDPATILEARSELAMLARAVEELTPRRRHILLASRLEGVSLHELAQQHGISQRMVERELKHAVLYCAQRLDRKVVRRFGPKPRNGSSEEDKEG